MKTSQTKFMHTITISLGANNNNKVKNNNEIEKEQIK